MISSYWLCVLLHTSIHKAVIPAHWVYQSPAQSLHKAVIEAHWVYLNHSENTQSSRTCLKGLSVTYISIHKAIGQAHWVYLMHSEGAQSRHSQAIGQAQSLSVAYTVTHKTAIEAHLSPT